VYRKSRVAAVGILAAAAIGGASAADGAPWYWSNGSKCFVSDHPPAYELAQTRAAGARLVEQKGGRTEIVLPSLEAYRSWMQKGFHFIFFANQQACNVYLQEQARIKADEDRAHQEYEKELQGNK
jgi:hypothetical protein